MFEFKPLTPEDVRRGLENALHKLEELDGVRIEAQPEALDALAAACGGDMRKALGSLEFAVAGAAGTDGAKRLTTEAVRQVAQRSSQRYDKSDDMHYDCISALQKSIRGSDPDAAVHYLARILEAGDLLSACRRLLVIAAEDVGLAYPQAIPIVKACVDSALQLGLPEARLPLADAAVLMATAPKKQFGAQRHSGRGTGPAPGQNRPGAPPAAEQAFRRRGRGAKGQNYLYPHDYPGHWVKQQYLPDALAGVRYYEYGQNKTSRPRRLTGTKSRSKGPAGRGGGRKSTACACGAGGGRPPGTGA